MIDVLVILFGGFLGYLIGRMGQKPTTNDETLQNQIDILQDVQEKTKMILEFPC
mgnify:CR=1 FL=1